MNFLTIDKDICNKDGICAEECPMKIIHIKDGFPAKMDSTEDLCIRCGHCVAICPTGAFSLNGISPEDCLPVNRDYLLDQAQAEHFLRYRRSIRSYKDKAVPKETLADLIRIASHAPSGHNTQSLKWQVIYNREDVKQFSGMVIDWMRHMIKIQPKFSTEYHFDMAVSAWESGFDTINRGAPHLILANGEKTDLFVKNTCTIALTYLELALPSFGLGGCWNGIFSAATVFWPPLKEALGLTETMENHGVMMLGFPKFKYHRMPLRNAPEITWA